MAEITRLSGHRDWIDLDFAERERTPEPAMAQGIQSHGAGLSLSNTTDLLEDLVSSGVGKQSTIGFRKPIYSPNPASLRIRSHLTKQ